MTIFGLAAIMLGIAALSSLVWRPFSWVLLLQTIVHCCIAGMLGVYVLAAQATPHHHYRYRRSLGDLVGLRFSWMPWHFARLSYALVLIACLAELGVVLLVLIG